MCVKNVVMAQRIWWFNGCQVVVVVDGSGYNI